MTIRELTEANEMLKEEFAEMQVQIKRTEGEQEKQNRQYKMTNAVQRTTQKLLQTALTARQKEAAAKPTKCLRQGLPRSRCSLNERMGNKKSRIGS